jgi:undecaprenyl-phosphate galactose phosphotransferase/putative colanic acid biosynthesis UDP-glucose lipid carrier transferase
MSVGGSIEQPLGGHKRLDARLGVRLPIQSISFLVALGDLAIIFAAALVSARIYGAVVPSAGTSLEYYAVIGVVCFFNFVIIGTARKSYQIDALIRFSHQTSEVVLTWAVVGMVTVSLIFATKAASDVSRIAVALFLVTGLFALLGWRGALRVWLAKAIEAGTLSMRPVILVARREELLRSEAVNQIRRAGYSPTVTLTFGHNPTVAHLRELAADAIRVAAEQPIDSIMLLVEWSDEQAIDQLVSALRVLPLPVHLLPDYRTARLIPGGTSAIVGVAAAQLQRAPLTNAERTVKRAFDVVLAAAGLVLLSPLLAVIALLIRWDSPGPALFRQTRNGFGGKPFRILKFRTMTVAEDGAEVRQARRGDPRLTRLGGWLRKNSLDELPQLWNVLRGDMSIVGPRPHPTALNAEYQSRIGNFAFRHHVRPGLTGWAQVHGYRGETNTLDLMERRVEHDLYYINHWRFFLDVLIVLLTVRTAFRDPAAF